MGVTAQEQQGRKKVVIASAPNKSMPENINRAFMARLGAGLTESGRYEVLTNRKDFAAVQSEEAEFQESGLVDDKELLQLGKALGADYACYVEINEIFGTYDIVCNFTDLNKGTLVGTFSQSAKAETLVDAARELARSIAKGRDVTAGSRKSFITMKKFYLNEYGDVVDYDIGIRDEEAMTYAVALAFCGSKGEGWRLPTKEELSFIYRKRYTIEKEHVEEEFKPFNPRDYWSSSKRNNYESYIVNFATGTEEFYSVNIKNTFRCVRWERFYQKKKYEPLKHSKTMSIIYNTVERGKPGDAAAPKRWYPLLKSTGMIKEVEVAKLLADETTLNAKEAELAIAQLMKVVTSQLLNGKTVQLGELGSFRVTAATEASDTEAEATAVKIKKLNVRFTPSQEFRNALKKAKFIDAASLKKK